MVRSAPVVFYRRMNSTPPELSCLESRLCFACPFLLAVRRLYWWTFRETRSQYNKSTSPGDRLAASYILNASPKAKSRGVAPHANHFLCAAKESNPRNAAPVCRRYAVPCVARLARRLRNSRYALRQSSPTTPDQSALLGGAQGIKSKTEKTGGLCPLCRAKPDLPPQEIVRAAHTKPLCCYPLSAASIRRERAVGLGEHCLSTWPRSGSRELRSPARLRLIEGTRRAANRGRLLFGYFFLARQEKVTSCRATPGAFDVNRCSQPILRELQRACFDETFSKKSWIYLFIDFPSTH
jgi:hypothetical protein